jgi:hypothetical protein
VAYVFALVVDINKLFQRLDDIEVVLEIDDDILAACVQAVVEESERLENSVSTNL